MTGFFCPRCCWYTTTLTFFYCFFHYGGNFVTQKRLDHCNGFPAQILVFRSRYVSERRLRGLSTMYAQTTYQSVVSSCRLLVHAPIKATRTKPLAIKLGKAREKKTVRSRERWAWNDDEVQQVMAERPNDDQKRKLHERSLHFAVAKICEAEGQEDNFKGKANLQYIALNLCFLPWFVFLMRLGLPGLTMDFH